MHSFLRRFFICATCLLLHLSAQGREMPPAPSTWTADNGNGTFTNPLFYDEFSDPDLIRVGDDFYLTGTTMHTMPGLPVLHSRDLVNWTLLGYAFDRLDLGPEFRMQDGREIYGQGIWAPSFRYHNGTFHIFTNINRHTTQLFRATNPAGPWTRTPMKRSLHDLSVLFDDDGKVWVIWGYQELKLAQLTEDLTDIVPGTERTISSKDSGMGEGVHFYKINGNYIITSAWFAGRMRMPCARADRPEGPYEINPAISIDEDFGLAEGNRLQNRAPPFVVVPGNTEPNGRMSLHQGGIVDTPTGEWWGFSMMDFNSVGRLTCLSPVFWQDGWPYFGLPGNRGRTPRTWLKPDTGHTSSPTAPYRRDDDFDGPALETVWQWNHVPDDTKWSLSERRGYLRMHALPATDFWSARNTLTQRSIGPVSIPTVEVDTANMQPGDVAGLALLNLPYAWIGVTRSSDGASLEQYDQLTGKATQVPLDSNQVWLRAHCDFLTEKARFSFSTDGKSFQHLGDEFTMVFQLKTFQGIRYSLFNFNKDGRVGGTADFAGFTVEEPHPRGLMRPVPTGQRVSISAVGGRSLVTVEGKLAASPRSANTSFLVVDRQHGRVALRTSDNSFISVGGSGEAGSVSLKQGEPGDSETFQWTENVYGDLMLLSLATHRHLRIDPVDGRISADHPGPAPDRKDGSCFHWEHVR